MKDKKKLFIYLLIGLVLILAYKHFTKEENENGDNPTVMKSFKSSHNQNNKKIVIDNKSSFPLNIQLIKGTKNYNFPQQRTNTAKGYSINIERYDTLRISVLSSPHKIHNIPVDLITKLVINVDNKYIYDSDKVIR